MTDARQRLVPADEAPAGFARLAAATADIAPPYAVVDLGALHANAAAMAARANGTPIRLASKSVRCREILRSVHARPGFRGVLAFTLPEAVWLADPDAADGGFDDVLVGYPSTDTAVVRAIVADERLAARVTLMVDSVAHLDLIAAEARAVAGTAAAPVRVCLDLDASLRLFDGRVHLGTRRSPVRSPAQLVELARAVLARPQLRLVGVMSYEGQIAGIGDDAPGSPLRRVAIRAMQRRSAAELRDRRAEAIAAVRAVAPLEFVNGGGTGSIEATSAEAAVTEIGAGSGLYSPTLFDHYQGFRHHPAAFFVLAVVRKPTPEMATVLGGGWIASGPVGRDRLPGPMWPTGLRLTGTEGAGEVQTPLVGPGAAGLRLADRVWFRHAKAGELCERVDTLHLVDGDRVIAAVPTYRGEGRTFV